MSLTYETPVSQFTKRNVTKPIVPYTPQCWSQAQKTSLGSSVFTRSKFDEFIAEARSLNVNSNLSVRLSHGTNISSKYVVFIIVTHMAWAKTRPSLGRIG